MNPISSGSQTPKRRWQEPQLPSQRWPGEGGLQGCDDKGRWLLPHSPQSGGGGAAEGCRAPAGRGRGWRGLRVFRASGGRRPRLNPRHLPLIAARRGRGRGAPAGPESAPSPWRPVCGPRALSPRGKLRSPISPFPGRARGSRDRCSLPPRIPVTAQPRGGAQPTAPPTPTPVTT